MVNNISYSSKKIGFIGGGKMASAIMGGIIKSSFVSPLDIFVYDINNDTLDALCSKFNVNHTSSIRNLAKSADVVVIATKPFAIDDVLNELRGYTENKLVVSILAGVTSERIENGLKETKVVRVMPNTPAFVNEGMCALCKGKLAQTKDVEYVESMLKNIGRTVVIDEKYIDIVTAISGSGPAFYYYIIDLIAKAGEKLGLDYNTCLMLSSQTALGSAKMLLESKQSPQELINAVTTPGGCTAVGNDVLKNSNIQEIINKTIKDTMEKASALG